MGCDARWGSSYEVVECAGSGGVFLSCNGRDLIAAHAGPVCGDHPCVGISTQLS